MIWLFISVGFVVLWFHIVLFSYDLLCDEFFLYISEKTLVFHEEEYLHGAPDSPGREISPKLVMGTKKYGRRSRPQSLVSDSSLTDSDTETIAVVPNMNSKVILIFPSSLIFLFPASEVIQNLIFFTTRFKPFNIDLWVDL